MRVVVTFMTLRKNFGLIIIYKIVLWRVSSYYFYTISSLHKKKILMQFCLTGFYNINPYTIITC